MKRVILILTAIILMCGCEKESNNNPLVGTKWETDGFGALMEVIWGYKYHVYDFYSETTASSYWLDQNGKVVGSFGEVTYKVEEPYVYITDDDNDVTKLEILDRMSMVITTNTSIKYYKQ